MYLKRLELYGFKSFHEKTVLDFTKGITAVVGPNGSGKSNIADAIRWVLGEQSVRTLRGQRMEDVIFSGTANRRGVSFAEVTLVLDNAGGGLDVTAIVKSKPGQEPPAVIPSEIAVSRRLYRSGESQYAVNGVFVRLKDIHALFMDTGIGREGYSLIGQGHIEDMLSVKPDDRRAIFEEAAGIIKYKSRRDEAQTKLERERQSYLRICDIIAEIDGQLEPLAAMAEKARIYQDLMDRYKLVKVGIFRNLTDSHEEQLKKAETDRQTLTEQMTDLFLERDAKLTEAGSLREALRGLLEETDRLRDKHAELGTFAQNASLAASIAEERIKHINEQKTRLLNDIKLRNDAVQAGEDEKFSELADLEELAETVLDKEESVAGLRDALERQTFEENELRADIDRFNALHIEQIKGVTDVTARVEVLAAGYAALEARKEAASDELAQAESELSRQQTALAEAEAALAENQSAAQDARNGITALADSKARLDSEYTSLKNTHKAEATVLAEALSRHKLLTELEESYEGYQYSVKSLLQAVRDGKAGLRGLHGAIGELITVPSGYETCVEVSLGGAITDIVADDEDAAKGGISFLKERKAGRATFLPLSSIKGHELGLVKDKLLREPGILGSVSDFIQCDNQYRNIVSYLQGRTLAAKDMDAAIMFSRKYGYAYKVVTLAGDVINPGGAITGGYTGKAGAILSRKRELSQLSEAIALSQEVAANRGKRLDNLAAKLASVSSGLEKAKVAHHELQIKEAALTAGLAEARRLFAGAAEVVKAKAAIDAELSVQLTSGNIELRQWRTSQKSAETGISGLLAEINQKQEGLAAIIKTREAAAKRVSGLETELARLSEAIRSRREGIARTEAAIDANKRVIDGIYAEIKVLDAEAEQKTAEAGRLQENKAALDTQIAGVDNDIASMNQKKAVTESSLSAYGQWEMESLRLENKLKLELERQDNRRENLEAERRRLTDEMWEEFGVTPQTALELPRLELSLPKLRQEEGTVKAGIRELGGTVNVGAVEEYRLVRERHGFLTKQKDDIEQAEEGLTQVINDLNSLMEARFREQFNLISKNFGDVFTEMFGGGTAYLKLADESDALNSAVDIVAQPPGKTLQSMTLFSGGERALCAIALLFGILRLKPSPFCVLDEIETALDDANVKRFANFIRHYRGRTQFIVITHRKGTMEAADALYGVTMQEAGVSKLIGVRLDDPGDGHEPGEMLA